MHVLIVKLGATGDVVRTTPLLRRFEGKVTWVTAAKNKCLLESLPGQDGRLTSLSWEDRASLLGQTFDLVVNLEDEVEVAEFVRSVSGKRVFGACLNGLDELGYSSDAQRWFDLSLISVHGREKANALKLANRHSYQELLFDGLGIPFQGEEYIMPPTQPSPLQGDVAIAAAVGAVWPMKKWAQYEQLKTTLEDRGLTVNFLPTRPTLLEHLADVRGHRCMVCGDTLPMHLALGSGLQCVALFNCTSPWEIHDYGRLTKVVSPLLEQFFYKRDFDPQATTAIPFDHVLSAVVKRLDAAAVTS